jgi:hypothetical protein
MCGALGPTWAPAQLRPLVERAAARLPVCKPWTVDPVWREAAKQVESITEFLRMSLGTPIDSKPPNCRGTRRHVVVGTRHCVGCDVSRAEMTRCARGKAFHCRPACQRAHWPAHKAACKMAAAAAAAPAAGRE